MTPREGTAIALKLFALWLLAQLILALPGLTTLLVYLESFPERAFSPLFYVSFIGSFLLVGFLAVYVIWHAAHSALRSSENAEPEAPSTSTQAFLLQLGGCYFIVNSLAYLPRSFGFLARPGTVSWDEFLWPAGLLVQLLIGLLLLVRPRVWSQWLIYLRGRA